MRGCFITGTDTGVGKTVLAAAIVAALRARGDAVRALKPVITGLDEPPGLAWPRDDELLARLSGVRAAEVAPIRYGPAVSPHLAAAMSGRAIEAEELRGLIAQAGSGPEILVVEGVGGLLVPLAEGYSVRELARDAGLPLLLAARPGLGTINHTRLTLEVARAAGLTVAGVVLTPWPRAPTAMQLSNRATIAHLGSVPVATLPMLERADPEQLADAGRLLPLTDWLGASPSDRRGR